MRDGSRDDHRKKPVTHGGPSSYRNRKCRCLDCREVNTRKVREARRIRAARLRVDPSLAPHGRASTYTNWLCRCDPCSEAFSLALKKLRSESTVFSLGSKDNTKNALRTVGQTAGGHEREGTL